VSDVKTSNANVSSGRWQTLLGLVLLLVLVAAAVTGAWFGLKALFGLTPPVLAAIIASSATVLISVASLIVQRVWERRRQIEQEHRIRKIPVYEKFFEFWFSTIGTDTKSLDEPESLEFLRDFTRELMVWGSDEVLSEFIAFRNAAMMVDEGSSETSVLSLFALERLMLVMRKDIGHKNKGLEPGDLLRMFINDLDDAVVAASAD